MQQKGYEREVFILALGVLMSRGSVNAKPCLMKIKSVKGRFQVQFPEQPTACEYQVDSCNN